MNQTKLFSQSRYAKKKKRNNGGETERVRNIIKVLEYHPFVAKIWRQNSGKVFVKGSGGKTYPIQLAPKYSGDITGMTIDGRRIEIEVKDDGEFPSEGQANWIHFVNQNGGVAGWCRTMEEAVKIIDDSRERIGLDKTSRTSA